MIQKTQRVTEGNMPIPRPRQDESQRAFISRCMGNSTMKSEYPEQAQRSAVCYSQWGRRNNEVTVDCISNKLSVNYRLRTETYLGRKHLIAPVVMMVEGVHNGSSGPTLYTAEELAKFPEAWNGRPVPVDHPTDDSGPISCNDPQVMQQYTIGQLFNVHFTDGKLRGEIWIDEERAHEVSPTALAYIRSGRRLEVSTGVFTDSELATGQWNGEEYLAVARNLRPDHLALLPGERGACSWEDGCGVRANKGGDLESMKRTKFPNQQQSVTVTNQEEKEHPIITNQLGEGLMNTVNQVRQKLDSMDSETEMYFLEELYSDFFIYRVSSTNQPDRLYKRGYSTNESGDIEFADTMVEVRKKVDYQEVTQNNKDGSSDGKEPENNSDGGDSTMNPKVDALIESTLTNYNEEDREWLATLSDCQLDKMQPKETPPPSNNKEGGKDDSVTVEQAIETFKEKFSTMEEYLNLMPTEMREQVEYGKKLHQEKRDELISNITSNTEVYAKEELEKKDITELEKISQLVRPKANYAPLGGGNGVAVNSNKVEPLLPCGIEVENK